MFQQENDLFHRAKKNTCQWFETRGLALCSHGLVSSKHRFKSDRTPIGKAIRNLTINNRGHSYQKLREERLKQN